MNSSQVGLAGAVYLLAEVAGAILSRLRSEPGFQGKSRRTDLITHSMSKPSFSKRGNRIASVTAATSSGLQV